MKNTNPAEPKPHAMTGNRNAQRGGEAATDRIQLRCTPTEKKFWQSHISGDLSSHVRSLMPQVPN